MRARLDNLTFHTISSTIQNVGENNSHRVYPDLL
jgi:hypothetical protein